MDSFTISYHNNCTGTNQIGPDFIHQAYEYLSDPYTGGILLNPTFNTIIRTADSDKEQEHL